MFDSCSIRHGALFTRACIGCTLFLLSTAVNLACADNEFENYCLSLEFDLADFPTIVPVNAHGGPLDKEDKITLEPSGLAYDKDRQIWIGVSDNYNVLIKKNMQRYAIFWFRPELHRVIPVRNDATTPPKIQYELHAFPLFDHRETDLEPYDLEGIDYDEDSSYYYITSSLSLHADIEKSYRDKNPRYSVYRFKLRKSVHFHREFRTYKSHEFQVLKTSNDLESEKFSKWMLDDLSRRWSRKFYGVRPEPTSNPQEGGLNVEALASTGYGNLLFGLRGPLKDPGQGPSEQLKCPAIEVHADFEENRAKFIKEYSFTTTHGYGFRGLDRVWKDRPWYVAIIGPSSPKHCQLELAVWNSDSGKIDYRTRLPEDFVGEGIAVFEVISNNSTTQVKVGVVDDHEGRFVMKNLPIHVGDNYQTELKRDVASGNDLTVTLADDEDRPGTLRYAIRTAQPGDQILFDLDEPIQLSDQLVIHKDLMFEGGSLGDVTIKAAPDKRIFKIMPTRRVIMSRLILENGHARSNDTVEHILQRGRGGAILNWGTLHLVASRVSGSRADKDGGGIYNIDQLVIFNCRFIANSSGGSGGAVYNAGTLRFDAITRFQDNTIGPHAGGAGIYSVTGIICDVNGLSFSINNDVPQDAIEILTTS